MNFFEQNILQIYGEQGRIWLQSLPSIVDKLSKQWKLSNLTSVNNLSYNYVLKGYRQDKPVALKIAYTNQGIQLEHDALNVYDGNGCVRVIDSNPSCHALLLEQAIPGVSLKSLFPLNDDTALFHTVTVMQQLHSNSVTNNVTFPTIQDWLQDLGKAHKALARYHIHKAQALAQQLLASQATPVLLHGDLHHENILLSDRGWIAIDPKGVIGEPAYEVGAFIRSPHPDLLKQPKPKDIMFRRLELFAEQLSIDKQRLHDWSYVQAVLTACWAMQDGQTNPDMALAEATLLEK